MNFPFNIELTSTADTNRTIVSNIGRAIMNKLAVKFEGIEILSVEDFYIFACYRDLWKTKLEKKNAICQGIISNDGYIENCIKLRINAGDKSTSNNKDSAIACRIFIPRRLNPPNKYYKYNSQGSISQIIQAHILYIK